MVLFSPIFKTKNIMADESKEIEFYPKDLQDLLEDKEYGSDRGPVRHYDGEKYDDEDHEGAPWYDTGERRPDDMENIAIACRLAFMREYDAFGMRPEDLEVMFDAKIGLTRRALMNVLVNLGVFVRDADASATEGRDVWGKTMANLGVAEDGSVIENFEHAVETRKSQLDMGNSEHRVEAIEFVVWEMLVGFYKERANEMEELKKAGFDSRQLAVDLAEAIETVSGLGILRPGDEKDVDLVTNLLSDNLVFYVVNLMEFDGGAQVVGRRAEEEDERFVDQFFDAEFRERLIGEVVEKVQAYAENKRSGTIRES